MKVTKHDKIYQTTSEVIIGNLPAIKSIKMEIELDTVNNPIDSIIYTLMCAEEKRTNESKLEQLCAEARYEFAFTKLKEFLKEKYENENASN